MTMRFQNSQVTLTARTGCRKGILSVLALLAAGAWTMASEEVETPEYRGLWVDSWGEGFKTESQINQLIEQAGTSGFNILLPQIRKRGEVYFNSSLEPRAAELADDFDPLRVLIEKARAADPPLQVHPWVVMYPVWNNFRRAPDSPKHVFSRHPDWLTLNREGGAWDGGGYNLDPGHPGVQQHLYDVVMEILRDYEVDGIHLDYIRYRGPEWGYNETSVERFKRIHERTGVPFHNDELWEQFRREQVTALVRRIYAGAAAIRPEAAVSAATITWAPGPESTRHWTRTAAYGRVFQEWPEWMNEGILDLNMPMAYFDLNRYGLAWQRWTSYIKDHEHNRHTAIGIGFFTNSIRSSLLQIIDARQAGPGGGTVEGVAGFSSRSTNNENRPSWALFYALRAGEEGLPAPFANPAPVPVMPWKTAPTLGHVHASFSPDDDGRPFRLRGDGFLRNTVADSAGNVIFVNLPEGEYELFPTDRSEEGERITLVVEAGKVTHHEPGETFTDADEDPVADGNPGE